VICGVCWLCQNNDKIGTEAIRTLAPPTLLAGNGCGAFGVSPGRRDHSWQSRYHNVRWIVDYESEAGIALYQKLGLGFDPDEVAGVEPPEKQYTVVAINPKRVSAGYCYQQPERDSGISATCHH